MKLWVLPPSTRRSTAWPEVTPTKRSISGAKWPAKELRLIWVRYGSGASVESGFGSVGFIRGKAGSEESLSSAIKRNTLKAQRWPLWYLSSQLK